MPNIDPDLLRAFVAVAETGSFTAAAARIGRSQSAVSQKLVRLEELLKVRVFERSSRSLALTCDGERALRAARRLLDHYESFLHELGLPTTSPLLRLGVSENLVRTILPRILSRLRDRFPEMQIDLTASSSQEILAQFDTGALDVVIAKASRNGPASPGRVVWRESLVWVAAENYSSDPLCRAQLVMMKPPCAYRDVMTEALGDARREWEIGCIANNIEGVYAAVLGGLGVTVLGKSLVHQGMRILPPSKHWPALPSIEISVLGETSTMRPIFESLVSLLTDELNEAELLSTTAS